LRRRIQYRQSIAILIRVCRAIQPPAIECVSQNITITYLFRHAYFCSGFHRLFILLLEVELATRISASNQIMEHAIFDNAKIY
ncbi:unnamed protein product, partial [Callosobruchus maculatus]